MVYTASCCIYPQYGVLYSIMLYKTLYIKYLLALYNPPHPETSRKKHPNAQAKSGSLQKGSATRPCLVVSTRKIYLVLRGNMNVSV